MSKAFQVIAGKATKTPITSAYVYGERNSGTNYIQNLIMRNCLNALSGAHLGNPDNRATLGWKHGFPNLIGAPNDVLAIVVYRDPIAWLHSMVRNPWHGANYLHGLSFSQFIRQEWAAVVDDPRFGVAQTSPIWHRELMAERDPATGLRFANVMRLRNAKNRGFATLDHRFDNILRVNYEAVLANPQIFLDALCATYALRRKAKFDPISEDRGTPACGKYMPAPLPFTNAADLDFIRIELDLNLEESLGYTIPAAGQGRGKIAAA